MPTLAILRFNEVEFKRPTTVNRWKTRRHRLSARHRQQHRGHLRNGNIRAYGHFTREITDDTVLSDSPQAETACR